MAPSAITCFILAHTWRCVVGGTETRPDSLLR